MQEYCENKIATSFRLVAIFLFANHLFQFYNLPPPDYRDGHGMPCPYESRFITSTAKRDNF